MIADYERLQEAYDWFNQQLFGNTLPEVVITLRGTRTGYGYHLARNFADRVNPASTIDELAMNATYFDRSDMDVLSTLAHEMTHIEQEAYGHPSQGGYHNKAWVKLMERIGLRPYNTNDPDKIKQTGTAIHHDTISDGPFEQAANALLKTGWTLHTVEHNPHKFNSQGTAEARQQQKKKTKYTCPTCEARVWGKPGLNIECGDCIETFVEEYGND